MISKSSRTIVFAAIGLVAMAVLNITTFYSFGSEYALRAITVAIEMPFEFQILISFVTILFLVAVFLSFYRGVKMWNSKSWVIENRTITGLELKMEAAIFLGLGFTSAFIFVRGFF